MTAWGLANMAPLTEERYNIVRFFRNRERRRRVIHRGVSLAVAQLHCSDPRTRKEGVWFDAYEKA